MTSNMESELHMQLSSVVNGGIPLQMSSFCQLGPQNENIPGPTVLSSFLGDPFKDAHHVDNNKTVSYDGLFNRGSSSSSNFHLASTSLVPLHQEVPSLSPREMLPCNNYSFSLGSFPMDPIQSIENQDMNQWVIPSSVHIPSSSCIPYGTPLISHNELSLSLATYEPNVVQGCCSDMMSCSSVVVHNSQPQTRQQSVCVGSNSARPRLSREMVSGSEYLAGLQQILSELARFSLEGLDPSSRCNSDSIMCSSSNIPMISSNQGKGGSEVSADDEESFDDAPAESSNNRRLEVDAKKSELLGLLVSVDECYTRCVDEIHTVISAFHAATELDPQVHACFPLQTVSLVYKGLRERISNEILVMGTGNDIGSHRRDDVRSFEKAFIQKQWALQQLKRKNQHLWRPQRGLPERSVSVLRAWMFENFLHPYPKDAEKHLLAIKSGLTRSQVSNWFINARVRLWKPLVEEMCSEMNRRKGAREITNDNNSNQQSQLSIFDYSQRFNT